MNDVISKNLETIAHGKNGLFKTALNSVYVYRFDGHVPKQPCLYSACIVFICQGRKVGYVNNEELHYNADNYLILASPLPLECEVFASENKPLLGLIIEIDLVVLNGVWTLLDQETISKTIQLASSAKLAQATKTSDHIKNLIARLSTTLLNEEAARILGHDIIKEIYYRALKEEQAFSLYALGDRNSQFSRMAKVLTYIQQNLSESLSVEHLAEISNMSSPTFHRYFKKITGYSPIQFIKKARLSHAKDLMAYQGVRANIAAQAVGYQSNSQFCREFKRLFGEAPQKFIRNS